MLCVSQFGNGEKAVTETGVGVVRLKFSQWFKIEAKGDKKGLNKPIFRELKLKARSITDGEKYFSRRCQLIRGSFI